MNNENSPYKTPETNPKQDGVELDKTKKTARHILILTFLPMFLCLLCGLDMNDTGNYVLTIFSMSVAAAFFIAIYTACYFKRTRDLHIVGQLIMWIFVHVSLLFVGVFGCIFVYEVVS